jgi:DNA-binding NarL/FixJ family response regulator
MNEESHEIKVVLADDHAVVRSGIRQFLESAVDIVVIAEAEDGVKARELIQSKKPDVAVLDIQMPKATGIEVTRWVRANQKEVGVLILTAYDDYPYVSAVLQAGANGFILKTASPEDIVQAVRDVYEGKSVMDLSIAKKYFYKIASGRDEEMYEQLSDRELEVLELTAKGYTNKAIGVQLSISDRTVQGHLSHIFAKLQAFSRTEAVMKAVSLGWLSSDIINFEE